MGLRPRHGTTKKKKKSSLEFLRVNRFGGRGNLCSRRGKERHKTRQKG